MGDFLDSILNSGEIYEKYGIKGCAIAILALVLVIGGVIALAYALG